MEKGADFGILSRSPLMKASGMSDTDDSQTEIEAIDARLPLDAWHRERGARMVSFAGYVMPIQYEGIMAEHLWTREHAGLFDVSHMGQLLFSGEDADKALEALLPGDIIGLKDRSEEHTSELQSLMRISYAVFCLKKKKNKKR